MNRNRLKLLIALAATLALSACGAAGEKTGGGNVAAASSVNAPSPAPTPVGGATENVSTVVSTPSAAAGEARQDAPRAGGSRVPSNAPPAAVPTPRIGSGGNDFFLFTQARAALNSDAELRAANLTLDVKEGVATLTGSVANAALKAKAEDLVKGAGPKTVRNQLRVSAGN
jgi:hypothetical protein